jgi:hypothetical protein
LIFFAQSELDQSQAQRYSALEVKAPVFGLKGFVSVPL